MMDRATVLRKIRACLRLGKSANAHEAAAALRQAQKLMAEYDIEHADVAEDEREAIDEAFTERRGENPPIYVVALMNLIARAFCVQTLSGTLINRARLIFVGPQSRAEVACYAFTVLLRQLERDRRAYLARVRKSANRAARGDVFGTQWVRGASEVISAFVGEMDERIAGYLERKYPHLQSTTVETRKNKSVGYGDVAAGHLAGKRARLDRGLDGAASKQLAYPT